MADEQNPMPEEARTWVRHPVPPEMLAKILAEYNDAEFLADVQEVLAGGGLSSDEFLAEVDRMVEAVTTTPAGQAPADV
ncbi:MAG TPA: hypothetical protein VD866_18190 [Urbifossiella sp.]|nr:hypothetical protein [Urbifossiella sp.]